MMTHHTPEQIDAAFTRAPGILEKLKMLGVDNPYFELFSDASGCLVLGPLGNVTEGQLKAAQNLLSSIRPLYRYDVIGVAFCCGLVPKEIHGNEDMDFTQITESKTSRWQTLRMKWYCFRHGHRYQIGDNSCYDCGKKK